MTAERTQELAVINAIEHPIIDFAGCLSEDRSIRREWKEPLGPGQYARAQCADGEVVMVRDPLGCHKLFYGPNHQGDLVVASRIGRALELGVHLDDLASCPPGHVVRRNHNGEVAVEGDSIASRRVDQAFELERFQKSVGAGLEHGMSHLRDRFPDAVFAVCLSGGLDSSAVASFAKRILSNVVAVSFSLLSEQDAKAHLLGADPGTLDSISEDFSSAAAVSEALDMPLFSVLRTPDAILDSVATSVRLCQDWRDFNVHCAVVNLALAQDLCGLFPGRQVVALTGDLMNEFVCDYKEEVVDGTVYYPQPRIPIEKRRRFLVRGLDAGDREVGVFGAYGIIAVQVFSAVADLYLGIPGEMLETPNAKETLNGHLLAPSLLDAVNTSKRRAQVGGKDKGILGVFHRAGVDQKALERMWIRSLPETMRGDHPLDMIQIGRYRTTPRRGDESCAE